MKCFIHIFVGLLLLLGFILVWFVWSYFNPTRQDLLSCYLNNQICMDVFYYDRPDEDRSQRSLYFANHRLDQNQIDDWKNKHLIGKPDEMFGYWKDCQEVNDVTLVCSVQYLPAFKSNRCPYDTVEQYRLDDWKIAFVEIKIKDTNRAVSTVSEVAADRYPSLSKWADKQKANQNLWVYC